MRKDIIYVFIAVFSAIILELGMADMMSGMLLVLFSFLLVMTPSAILPVMFVASWSSSLSVMGVSAFFYYFALFLLSLVVNPAQVRWHFKKNISTTILSILFGLWLLISACFSVSGDMYIPAKLFLCILFPILTSVCSVRKMQLCYRALYIIAIVSSVYFLLRGIFAPVEMYDSDRMTSEMTLIKGVGVNVLSPAVVLMLLYSFAVSLRKKEYVLSIASFLFFFTLIFLGSRTSTYTALFFVFAYFIFFVRTKIATKLTLSAMVAVLAVVVIFLGQNFTNFERLDISTIQDDQGSGRFINWGMYFLYIIPNYLWLGIGPSIANYATLGYRYDADNLFIDLLCELGVPGLILFVVLFATYVYKASHIKSPFHKGLFITMLMAFLGFGLGETVFDSSLFWFVAGLALLEYNSGSSDNRKYKLVNTNNYG